MQRILQCIFLIFLSVLSYKTAYADPIDDVLRIWQETIWNWGSRIFWFWGVSAAILIAASPANRQKAIYGLGAVLLFYLTLSLTM